MWLKLLRQHSGIFTSHTFHSQIQSTVTLSAVHLPPPIHKNIDFHFGKVLALFRDPVHLRPPKHKNVEVHFGRGLSVFFGILSVCPRLFEKPWVSFGGGLGLVWRSCPSSLTYTTNVEIYLGKALVLCCDSVHPRSPIQGIVEIHFRKGLALFWEFSHMRSPMQMKIEMHFGKGFIINQSMQLLVRVSEST